jgi:hypothetical protein
MSPTRQADCRQTMLPCGILTVSVHVVRLSPSFVSVFHSDAVIEQQMPMTGASLFWRDALHGCQLDQPLSLPYDRHRLANQHRSGRGTSVSFDFGADLSRHFVDYASSTNTSMEHVALATYFVFLFKLTSGERDLCIGVNTDGRCRDELQSIVGMFVNAIPLRCRLDARWSFQQLLDCVCAVVTSGVKYSYFPLQRILAQHHHVSHPAFLDTSFEFVSLSETTMKQEVAIGGGCLSPSPMSIKISEDEIMSKFDFNLSIHHDVDTNELSGTIDVSTDLFYVETAANMAQRLYSIVFELSSLVNSQPKKPLCELSLTLPSERLLMQSMNNTQVPSPRATCIHHAFAKRAVSHSQKLAVELDEQSLTYAELLHHVQVLALHLLTYWQVAEGEIVCQCVERSLTMVSQQSNDYFLNIFESRLIIDDRHDGHRDGRWRVLSLVTA